MGGVAPVLESCFAGRTHHRCPDGMVYSSGLRRYLIVFDPRTLVLDCHPGTGRKPSPQSIPHRSKSFTSSGAICSAPIGVLKSEYGAGPGCPCESLRPPHLLNRSTVDPSLAHAVAYVLETPRRKPAECVERAVFFTVIFADSPVVAPRLQQAPKGPY